METFISVKSRIREEIYLFSRFIKYLHPYWKKGLIAFLLMLLGVGLQLPMPFLTKYLIDKVIVVKSFKLLNYIGILLIAILILRAIFIFIERYALATFRGRVLFDLRLKLFNHTERLKLLFFVNNETGYLMARLSDDIDAVQGLLADTFVAFIKNLMTFIAGVGATLFIHPKLAMISFSILPCYALSIWLFNKRIKNMSYEVREEFAKVNKDLQELLSGIIILKAFTAEIYGSLRLVKTLKNSIKKSIRLDILATFYSIISTVISSAGPIVVIWYGCGEIIRGNLSVGGLIAFNSFLRYLFGPTQQLMNLNFSVQRSLASVKRIFEILDTEKESYYDGTVEIKKLKGNIQFKNVSFSYNFTLILENITFTVESGTKVLIVGETGAGKSTIASLLLRFYEPISGVITIDGVDIKKIKLKSLRENISYVSQDVFLFSDTIKENIRLGNRNANDDEIIRAAKLACAHEFISKLPDGYDTYIGEKGIKLSGGERQRIALARAILKNAPILILDEATSNIDRKTEEKMIKSIENFTKDKTVIIIAHRLWIARIADKIIVLNNGKIENLGKHEDLLLKSSIYAELYRSSEK